MSRRAGKDPERVLKKVLSPYPTRTQTPLHWGIESGYTPQCETFMLPIPIGWYPKPLAHPKRTLMHPMQGQCKWWNMVALSPPHIGSCVGHVNFMLISCLCCMPIRTRFLVEYGIYGCIPVQSTRRHGP